MISIYIHGKVFESNKYIKKKIKTMYYFSSQEQLQLSFWYICFIAL